MSVTMKHQWIFPILCALSMGFWACSSPTSPAVSSNRDDPSNSAHPSDPAHSPDPDAPGMSGKQTIYYHGNGNTWGTTLISENHDDKNSDTVTIKDRGDLYRVGYQFAGWNTCPDGTGDNFEAGSTMTLDGAVKLYARWVEVFPYISAGDRFSTLLTREGKLYATGHNANGTIGNGATGMTQRQFTPVGGDVSGGGVKLAVSGEDHSFALLNDGSIRGWGVGNLGKLGNNNLGVSSLPTHPLYTSNGYAGALLRIADISAGRTQTAILTDSGEYWAAGGRASGALGNGGNGGVQPTFEKIADNVRSVSAGEYYVMVIKNDGTLHAAGNGWYGRTGTSANTTGGLTLNKAAGNDNARVFTGKLNHTMLLKNDGRLLAAGYNERGQLGIGNIASQNSFQQVIDSNGKPLTDVAFVSLGETHSMILRNDGTLWAAGNNREKQLGINGIAQTGAVKVLDNVARVAAGFDHTLVVTEDGKIWAAGSNRNGQFGVPSKVPGFYTWTEIAPALQG